MHAVVSCLWTRFGINSQHYFIFYGTDILKYADPLSYRLFLSLGLLSASKDHSQVVNSWLDYGTDKAGSCINRHLEVHGICLSLLIMLFMIASSRYYPGSYLHTTILPFPHDKNLHGSVLRCCVQLSSTLTLHDICQEQC